MSYDVPLAPGESVADVPEGQPDDGWPLWEVFVRQRRGLSHVHAGSLHAVDAETALQNARDVYTRRQEGVSVWVVRSADVVASDPDDAATLFEPFGEQPYRHATHYEIPDEVGHM
jgi:ring-1,2-phenylacetyl-CoA epoxidase subunit PaaB